MAFDIDNFNNVTSGAAAGRRMWSYATTADAKAAVKTSGYFDTVANSLTAGDLLWVDATDENMFLLVAAVTAGVVTVAVGPTDGT